MFHNTELNNKVVANFSSVKLRLLIPPFFLLVLIFLYFFIFNVGSNFSDSYVAIQKDLFFYLNGKLGRFPDLMFNLTQLGDVILSFALVTVFILYAPKLWEALLPAALISLLISAVLKKIFAVPRPAAMFDPSSFTIIGKPISGHTSLPSGHSIVTFIVVTVVLIAFMPNKNRHKIIWFFLMLSLGSLVVLSRVGVGAHYPLDVLIGSTIGYIIGITGIKISTTFNWFEWVKNKKYYPIYLFVLIIWGLFIGSKIVHQNLPIYYISLFSLLLSVYLMTTSYVKKNK